MQWVEVLEDKSLRDLPYKIETNRFGQIVMSPAGRDHTKFQGIILGMLFVMKSNGQVHPECPVQTPEGIKAPDVAWISEARLLAETDPVTFTVAPEVCIEVLSPSNRKLEIAEKKTLYFQQGADEVWVCDGTGAVTFFSADVEVEHSSHFPGFPKQI